MTQKNTQPNTTP